MNLTVQDLRLANKCPLILQQGQLYRASIQKSRILFEEAQVIFNNIFYQTMRERNLNPKRIIRYWKEAVARHKGLSSEDVRFPAQCMAIFLDYYTNRKNEDVTGPSVPFEVPVSPHVIVQDQHPLLTRTPYGSRITIFEFLPQARREIDYNDDIFYAAYVLGYRREFARNEFAVTIHNLGDGKRIDILYDEQKLLLHRELLEQQAELVYTGYAVPSFSQCPSCPIVPVCPTSRYAIAA